MKKIAIYTRVSRKHQSTDKQIKNLRDYCSRMGYRVYDYYNDVCSGLKDSRNEFNRLMEDVRLKKIDSVMVWKLDRLGRSLQHLLQILQELKNKNIGFISVTQNIDTSTATGKLMFDIIGSFAEFESSLISERVRAGKERSKIKQGRKNLKINKYEVMQLKQEGYSLREIGSKLNVSYGTVNNVLKGVS